MFAYQLSYTEKQNFCFSLKVHFCVTTKLRDSSTSYMIRRSHCGKPCKITIHVYSDYLMQSPMCVVVMQARLMMMMMMMVLVFSVSYHCFY